MGRAAASLAGVAAVLALLPATARADKPAPPDERRDAYSPYERKSIDDAVAKVGAEIEPSPEGKELDPTIQVLTTTNPVTPGYFQTLGIPLLRGRDFADYDTADSAYVAVVNEATVAKFWPGEDPIGRRFTFYGEPQAVEIVGVVADQLIQLGQPPAAIVYTPHEQWFAGSRALNIRTEGQPETTLGEVQNLVREMEPNLLIGAPTTIGDNLDQQLWAPRMGAGLLTIFGLLALVLAMIGVYGVMSNSVDQRAHEMGIRMALGAGRSQVILLVVRQGMLLVAVGLGAGLLVAIPAGRRLQGMLFDLSGNDPLTFGAVAAAMATVAFLATYLPARKLTRLDPSMALRTD